MSQTSIQPDWPSFAIKSETGESVEVVGKEGDQKDLLGKAIEKANEQKRRGNEAFKAKKHEEALTCYMKALQLLPANELGLRSSLGGNISLTHFHLSDYNEALRYIDASLKSLSALQTNEEGKKSSSSSKGDVTSVFVRNLCRKSTILTKMKQFQASLDALEEAMKVINSAAIKDGRSVESLTPNQRDLQRKEVERMMKGLATHLNKRARKQEASKSSAFKLQGLYDDKEQADEDNLTQDEIYLRDLRVELEKVVNQAKSPVAIGDQMKSLLMPSTFRKKVYSDSEKLPSQLESHQDEGEILFPNSFQELVKDKRYEPMLLRFMPSIRERADASFENIRKRGEAEGDEMSSEIEAFVRKKVLNESFALEVTKKLQAQAKEACLSTVNDPAPELLARPEDLEKDDRFDAAYLEQISSTQIDLLKDPDEFFIQEPAFLEDDDFQWQGLLRQEVFKAIRDMKLFQKNDHKQFRQGDVHSFWLPVDEKRYPALSEFMQQLKYLPYELHSKLSTEADQWNLCKMIEKQVVVKLVCNRSFFKDDAFDFSDDSTEQFKEAVSSDHVSEDNEMDATYSPGEVIFDSGFKEMDSGVRLSCMYLLNPDTVSGQLGIYKKQESGSFKQVSKLAMNSDVLLVYKSRHVGVRVDKISYKAGTPMVPFLAICAYLHGAEG